MRIFFPSGARNVREGEGERFASPCDNFLSYEREITRGDSGGGEVRDKMNPCGR